MNLPSPCDDVDNRQRVVDLQALVHLYLAELGIAETADGTYVAHREGTMTATDRDPYQDVCYILARHYVLDMAIAATDEAADQAMTRLRARLAVCCQTEAELAEQVQLAVELARETGLLV